MHLSYLVPPEADGMTLDHLLRSVLGFSAAQARAGKQAGITSDGARLFGNQPVHAEQRLSIPLQKYETEQFLPQNLPPVSVVYEDDALLAVRKLALLQCHPSPSAPNGSDTLEARVSSYLHAPAHPVHRLDAETTGLVLFSKLPYVQSHIQRQMQEGTFQKTYQAWVFGAPSPREDIIDAPIALSAPDSFTRVVRPDGQCAVSRYQVLETLSLGQHTASLVQLHPETGRTHQLRVHMTHIGCPLLGDTRYFSPESRAASDALGLAYHQLCAVRLSFVHPLTGRLLDLSIPADFAFHP